MLIWNTLAGLFVVIAVVIGSSSVFATEVASCRDSISKTTLLKCSDCNISHASALEWENTKNPQDFLSLSIDRNTGYEIKRLDKKGNLISERASGARIISLDGPRNGLTLLVFNKGAFTQMLFFSKLENKSGKLVRTTYSYADDTHSTDVTVYDCEFGHLF